MKPQNQLEQELSKIFDGRTISLLTVKLAVQIKVLTKDFLKARNNILHKGVGM